MKKQILTLLAIVFIYIAAAGQTYAEVNAWGTDKDSVYPGDSISFYFKFTPPNTPPFVPGSAIDLLDGSSNLINLWSGPWQSLGIFPRIYLFGDSVSVMRLKIPDNASPGLSRLYGSGSVINYTITILPKTATGIYNNSNKTAPISIKWFTLQGAELLQPDKSVINIRITEYEDGVFITDKIKFLE